jgi:hypothetical protein
LGVLGTQETFCIIIAWLFERDSFDLFLPEFDKPWVVHLRETCCCSTNLCTWRPNIVYKNRRVPRHQVALALGGSIDPLVTGVEGTGVEVEEAAEGVIIDTMPSAYFFAFSKKPSNSERGRPREELTFSQSTSSPCE